MKNNQFDNYVKEHLGSLRPEVPAHIWRNIAAKKDRKVPVAFWGIASLRNIAAAVLLLLAGGIGTWLLVNSNNSSVNKLPGDAATTEKRSGNLSAGNNTSNGSNNPNSIFSPDNSVDLSPAAPSIPDAAPGQTSVNQRTVGGLFSTNVYAPALHGIPGDDVIENVMNESQAPLSSYNIYAATFLKYRPEIAPGVLGNPLLKNLSIPCPTVEKDAAGNKRYVEIYAGPDYAFRNITDLQNGAYARQRENSTRILSAYSAGIRYTKVFGSGISIRTGINYSRINEAFKLERGHVIQNVYITGTDGDTTGTYTVSGTQYKQSTNKYQSVDVPITAGYELGNGRLHANINAGVLVNVTSRQTGFVVGENGEAVDISTGKSVYRYKTHSGVSLTGGVSVYYKLNDNLHILAEPYIRYAMSPVTQSELSLKQKYHAAGLRIGLRADL